MCEKYSTQMCSNCFELTGPKGEKDLNVRKWTCSGCGLHHQRDENAAINISRILEDLGLMESIKKWNEMHCKTFFSALFFEDDLNLTQMELKALLPRCRQFELNLKGKDKDLNSREMGKKFTA